MARRKGHQSLKRSVAIVGDGYTEKEYFGALKRVEELQQLTLKPELPVGSGSFTGVLDKARQLVKEGYDRVYAVIDMDQVGTQRQLPAYKEELAKYRKWRNKGSLCFIECNPCFEIWLLLHFVMTTRLFRRCDELIEELKQHLSDYRKERSYITGTRLYEQLHGQIPVAMENSQKLHDQQADDNSDRFPKCDVFEIINDLEVAG